VVHVEIAAEKLFAIGPLIVTNSMVGAVLASVVLLLIARWFTRRSGIVPGRGQSAIELPIEFLAGVVRDPIFGPIVALGLGGVLAEQRRRHWRPHHQARDVDQVLGAGQLTRACVLAHHVSSSTSIGIPSTTG